MDALQTCGGSSSFHTTARCMLVLLETASVSWQQSAFPGAFVGATGLSAARPLFMTSVSEKSCCSTQHLLYKPLQVGAVAGWQWHVLCGGLAVKLQRLATLAGLPLCCCSKPGPDSMGSGRQAIFVAAAAALQQLVVGFSAQVALTGDKASCASQAASSYLL